MGEVGVGPLGDIPVYVYPISLAPGLACFIPYLFAVGAYGEHLLKGLARFFLYYLTKRALELNIKRFITETIMGNAASIHLLRDFAASGLATHASMENEGGVVILTWEFTPESFQKGAEKSFRKS